jgi:hypothetical protein
MRRARLTMLAGLAALVLVPADGRAESFDYVATLTAPARREGAVTAGGITWTCKGPRCTSSGPWPVPGEAACAALAAQVGTIAAYGHKGARLSPAQLARCNVGVQPKVAAPPTVTPAPPVAGPRAAPRPAIPRTVPAPVTPRAPVVNAGTLRVVGRSVAAAVTAPTLVVVGRPTPGAVTTGRLIVVGRPSRTIEITSGRLVVIGR